MTPQIKSIASSVKVISPYNETLSEYLYAEQSYNEHGDLVCEVVFDENGEIDSKKIFELNDEGKIVAQMSYERKNNLIERTDFFDDTDDIQYRTEVTTSQGEKTIHEYAYDNFGNTEKITIRNEDNEVEAYEIFVHNDNGNLIEEIRLNANHQIEFRKTMSYDSRGLLQTETYFDRDRPSREVAHYYNDLGQLVEKNDLHLDTHLKTINRYTYDLTGNQIIDETSENGKVVFLNHCSYDEHGNLIEERIMNTGQENYIEIRDHVITYGASKA